jgi:hypothetical protein
MVPPPLASHSTGQPKLYSDDSLACAAGAFNDRVSVLETKHYRRPGAFRADADRSHSYTGLSPVSPHIKDAALGMGIVKAQTADKSGASSRVPNGFARIKISVVNSLSFCRYGVLIGSADSAIRHRAFKR